jgi:hypothetical protein
MSAQLCWLSIVVTIGLAVIGVQLNIIIIELRKKRD